MLIVHQLAGILLDMDALDPNRLGLLALGLDGDRTLTDKRMIKLRNLVTLRQIGVEVVLAIEARPCVDLGIQRHAGAHRLTDALLVEHGQHAGHGRVDEADLAVGLGPERGRRTGEELGLRRDLRVDLKADHDLPLAGAAMNAIAAHLTTTFPGGR